MTSSATQTEGTPVPSLKRGGAVTKLLFVASWVFVGLMLILFINKWHFGAPQFFLLMGWVAVLLIGSFLYSAAVSAGLEGEGDDSFDIAQSARDELIQEKRSLLKTIKEIEFDHLLGKTSDADAKELTSIYRARAIEIIKELEQLDNSDSELDFEARVERELRARIKVDGAGKKAEAVIKGRKKRSEAKLANTKSADKKSAHKKSKAAKKGSK